MKSRLAMLGLLVGGMLMSGTGATLAVSGISSSGSAGTAQYTAPPPATTQTSPPGVAPPTGITQQGGGTTDQAQVLDQAEAAQPRGGQVQPGGDDRVAPETAQVPRQVEAGATGGGSDELPFTGFAAIPILLAGVAMMVSGLVLRRRSADGS